MRNLSLFCCYFFCHAILAQGSITINPQLLKQELSFLKNKFIEKKEKILEEMPIQQESPSQKEKKKIVQKRVRSR